MTPTGPDEPPPWGTPDLGDPGDPGSQGSAAGAGPAYGTPPLRPQTGPDPDAAPAYGTPSTSYPPMLGDDLWTAPTVVVVERVGFLSGRGYDLFGVDDQPLGSVQESASFGTMLFGRAAGSTFTLLDQAGRQVGGMSRPGSFGRSVFVVRNSSGADVGTVEQEGFGGNRLLLTTSDRLVMRLLGGGFGSREWDLVDGLDDSVLMGRIAQEYAGLAGMISDAQRFAVQLSPQLVGDHRLLALLACVCLDDIRDARRRR